MQWIHKRRRWTGQRKRKWQRRTQHRWLLWRRLCVANIPKKETAAVVYKRNLTWIGLVLTEIMEDQCWGLSRIVLEILHWINIKAFGFEFEPRLLNRYFVQIFWIVTNNFLTTFKIKENTNVCSKVLVWNQTALIFIQWSIWSSFLEKPQHWSSIINFCQHWAYSSQVSLVNHSPLFPFLGFWGCYAKLPSKESSAQNSLQTVWVSKYGFCSDILVFKKHLIQTVWIEKMTSVQTFGIKRKTCVQAIRFWTKSFVPELFLFFQATVLFKKVAFKGKLFFKHFDWKQNKTFV